MAHRTILHVSLPPEMDSYIARCVRSGRFASASEVVRARIRLLQAQDQRVRAGEREHPDPLHREVAQSASARP